MSETYVRETYTLWVSCLNCGNLFAKCVPFGVEVKERANGLRQDLEWLTCLNCGSSNVRKWKDDWGKIRPWPKTEFLGLKSLMETGYMDLVDLDTRSRILRSILLSVEVEPMFHVADNLAALAANIRKEATQKRKEVLEGEA